MNPIITVLADAGVRVSELVAINWEYLDSKQYQSQQKRREHELLEDGDNLGDN